MWIKFVLTIKHRTELKKVLVVTYYWPPSGGPGVQRVLKFCKYLPEYGITPVVLTVAQGDYPAVDETLVNEIDASVHVYRVKGWEPHNLYRKFTGMKSSDTIPVRVLSSDSEKSFRERIADWVRLNLFIPDARRFLVRPFAAKAIEIVQVEHVDAILTSSPPHSIQLVGLTLKKKLGSPWVADFRDPWVDVDYYQGITRCRFAIKKDTELEREVVNSLDALVAVEPSIVDDLKRRCRPKRTSLIYNGFDEDDFSEIGEGGRASPCSFTIVYYGSLGIDRTVPEFVQAFGRCVESSKGRGWNLKMKYIGKIDEGLKRLFENASLMDNVDFVDYLPHKELLKEAARAAILLLIINRVAHNKGILPAKLFEYLAFGIPVLGIGPTDGHAAKILAETGAGKMVSYNDIDLMVQFILQCMEAPREKEILLHENVLRYSRRNLAGQLAKILREI